MGNAKDFEGNRSHFTADSYSKLLNYAKELRDPAGETSDSLKGVYNAILEPLTIRPTYKEQDNILYPGMKIQNKQMLSNTYGKNHVGLCHMLGKLNPEHFGNFSSKDSGCLQVVLPKGLVLENGYCYNNESLYEKCGNYLETEPGLINDGYKLKEQKTLIMETWHSFRDFLDEKDVARYLARA